MTARQTAQLCARLKALRVARGYTMRRLAVEAGISSGTVSELESGRIQPALGTMLALQRAFGLSSIEELLAPAPAAPVMPSVQFAALSELSAVRSA